jgi:predicted membrane channel-forming protein YqfA (hemolysin III family)
MRVVQELIVSVAFVAVWFTVRWKMGTFRFGNAFRRVVAIGFISLGTLGVIVCLVWTGWPEVFRDEPPAPLFGKFVSQVLFVLAAGFGVYLVRAPTYRPDLGDTMRLMSNEPWSEELVRRKGRSWWTGDPRPPINDNSHTISAG